MQGTYVKCKCGEQHILEGPGYGYPHFYQEAMDKIKKGKYGSEMKRLADETELIAVDARQTAYVCEECGKIECDTCLDLYKPEDIEAARKSVVGRWTAGESQNNSTTEELGEWPYWYPYEPIEDEEDDGWRPFGGGQVLIKEYEHMCPECKTIMRKLSTVDKCPKCGEKYEYMEDLTIYD